MKALLVVLPFAASLVIQPLVDSDVLEPSVRNEVDHALSRVPPHFTNCAQRACRQLPFPTNGLSCTEIAIRAVSLQRADGRWMSGTNDVTAATVRLLETL